MIAKLKPRTADIAIDILSASGPPSRAARACRVYRRDHTPANERMALAELNALNPNILAEIKSAAGIS